MLLCARPFLAEVETNGKLSVSCVMCVVAGQKSETTCCTPVLAGAYSRSLGTAPGQKPS